MIRAKGMEWSIQFNGEREKMTLFQPTALIRTRTPHIRGSGVTTSLPLDPPYPRSIHNAIHIYPHPTFQNLYPPPLPHIRIHDGVC